MRKQQRKHGFTIVELIVVIAVISILAGISILAYTQQQKQSRDDKRNSDMTMLQNELEKYYDKNGEYPPGCPTSSCGSWFLTDNTSSSQMLNSAATVTNIQTVLPGINNIFGDPKVTSTTPLMDTTTAVTEYYYFGGAVDNRASASSLAYTATASFPCGINIALSPGNVGSYVIGYFSENANAWVLRGGKNGIAMTITSGTSAQGCVINAS